jgi:hypothetical protein
MAQVVNEYRGLGNALGESLGQGLAGFGTGFGESLKQLAQHKIDTIKGQHGESILRDIGVDPLSARFISAQPAKQQAGLVADYFRQQQQENEQEQNQIEPQENEPIGVLRALEQEQSPMEKFGGLSQLFNQGLPGAGINQQYLQALQQAQQPQPQAALPQVQQPQTAVPQKAPVVKNNKGNNILARALANSSSTTSTQQSKIQSAIDKQNAPYLKGLTKAVDNAETTVNALNTMEQLLDTGNVTYGVYGASTPYVFLSPESQQFDKEANTLAQQLAGQTGVPTGFKIKFAQTQKPNLTDSPETQRNRIHSLRKEAQKVLDKGAIRDELIEANGGNQPKNLETLINKRYHALSKQKESGEFEDLPDPALYKGKIATDEQTGERRISDGTQWLPVEG